MRTARPLLLLPGLLLGGCAVLDQRLPEAGPGPTAASVAATVEQARGLAAEDRWMAAVRLLEAARRRQPESTELIEALAEMEAGRAVAERLLDDRLLAAEAEHAGRKIELLERLAAVQPQPESLLTQSRRLFLEEVQQARLGELVACAQTQVARDPELARRCLDQATALAVDDKAAAHLAVVAEQLRASEAGLEQRRLAEQRRARQQRARALLSDARAAIDRHDYRGALDLLAQVERLQPGDREMAGLRDQAQAMLSPQIDALVRLGDHLYLDEQLEAAVAAWQAALSLMPGDEEVQARIDRARTVLNRLEDLRRQQKAVTGGD